MVQQSVPVWKFMRQLIFLLAIAGRTRQYTMGESIARLALNARESDGVIDSRDWLVGQLDRRGK